MFAVYEVSIVGRHTVESGIPVERFGIDETSLVLTMSSNAQCTLSKRAKTARISAKRFDERPARRFMTERVSRSMLNRRGNVSGFPTESAVFESI